VLKQAGYYPVEEQAIAQGNRFRAAAAAPSALAYRHFLHQPERHLLLLCSILDGFSRFLVHWDLRESMRETDIEVILQRAKEKYPEAKPRNISDNGPQFIARDFKEFIRISGMTHVRTSPNYPQSNGKLETLAQVAEKRMHSTGDAAVAGRCKTPDSTVCGPIQLSPAAQRDRLRDAEGHARRHQQEIQAERDRKLDAAKEQRKNRRQRAA